MITQFLSELWAFLINVILYDVNLQTNWTIIINPLTSTDDVLNIKFHNVDSL